MPWIPELSRLQTICQLHSQNVDTTTCCREVHKVHWLHYYKRHDKKSFNQQGSEGLVHVTLKRRQVGDTQRRAVVAQVSLHDAAFPRLGLLRAYYLSACSFSFAMIATNPCLSHFSQVAELQKPRSGILRPLIDVNYARPITAPRKRS